MCESAEETKNIIWRWRSSLLENQTMSWVGNAVERCPACSSSGFIAAGKRSDSASVSKCKKCGLGFLNPMPTREEIDEMYSSYFARGDGIGYADYRARLTVWALDYAIWNSVKRFGDSSSTHLDVGCAFGARVAFFRKKGLRSSGIDIQKEAIEVGRRNWNLDLYVGKFEEFEPNSTYDVITMIDFIEHLSSPASWVRKVQSLTHQNSLLVILTPDFDCYSDYGERWTGYNASYEHILFYNRRSLDYLLGQTGFAKALAANFRSLPPAIELTPVPRHSIIGDIYPHIRWFPKLTWLNDLRIRVRDALAWERLLRYDERQNSLFYVAKRTR